MNFRPCIDLHEGKVKQIVGGSLVDGVEPETNYVSEKPPAWYAELYCKDQLHGGHVIKLGKDNDDAARQALAAWPGGLQVGGGITVDNAEYWLDAGAAKVIVTSHIFTNGQIDEAKLDRLYRTIGRERLVLDLSCRRKGDQYFVVTDRWQTFTETVVDVEAMRELSRYCCEFLVHGVDVEGKQQGMDQELLAILSELVEVPVVYAGGVRSFADLDLLKKAGKNRVDVTIGSALDLFGGTLPYADVVTYCSDSVKK